MMKIEVRRDLPKTELPGYHDRLIARLDDSVGGAHANGMETRTDHERIKVPSAVIIGKIIQPEGNWVFNVPTFHIREEERVV
jgi:hypothetical protein